MEKLAEYVYIKFVPHIIDNIYGIQIHEDNFNEVLNNVATKAVNDFFGFNKIENSISIRLQTVDEVSYRKTTRDGNLLYSWEELILADRWCMKNGIKQWCFHFQIDGDYIDFADEADATLFKLIYAGNT